MIKKVSKEFVYDFAIKFFPSFSKVKGPFDRVLVYLDDCICGFISYSVIYDRAEIEYIAVGDDYLGKGVSDELFDAFINDISGCVNVSLEVDENNKRAINFYLKHGFVKKGIRKNYYKNSDGILMVLELR